MPRLVLALALSLAAWSCGHPPRAGVRDGSLRPMDDPTLAGLEVAVRAYQIADRPLELTVFLSTPGAHRDACFTASDGDRVTLDGRPVPLASIGGAAAPIHASGVAWQVTACDPVAFSIKIEDPAWLRAELSEVIVDHAGRKARVAIKHLLRRRELHVLPSDHVRPGQVVTLEWNPREDEWSGPPSAPPHVFFFAPNEFGIDVPVKLTPPSFRFAVPAVRPGPARAGLSFLSYEAHPNITVCRGFARCSVTQHNGPSDVAITVL